MGDEIEVDSEPYGDNFARPARLLPLEAKALVAAIDLFGDHLPQGGLQSAREQDRQGARPRSLRGGAGDRLGGRRRHRGRPGRQRSDRRPPGARPPVLQGERGPVHKALGRALRLENGKEGWYVECYDLTKEGVRHFKLDRIKEAGLSKDGFEPRPEVGDRRRRGLDDPWRGADRPVARVWVSPERARWLREERTVVEELADGAVVVELPYAGTSWLVREILRGAGDLVVLEPDDARDAIAKEVAG